MFGKAAVAVSIEMIGGTRLKIGMGKGLDTEEEEPTVLSDLTGFGIPALDFYLELNSRQF